jgi:hypothetical protein
MKSINRILLVVASSAFLAACGMGGTDVNWDGAPVGAIGPDGKPVVPEAGTLPDGTTPQPGPSTPASICEGQGRKYTGFGGTSLQVGRIDVALGTDNGRVKPFTALAGYAQTNAATGALPAATGEYQRVLANNPTLLAQSAATFGPAPDRWYVEPQSSAVALFTAYRIAFQGCLTFTGAAQFATAPTPQSAATECAAMGRKFWSKTPGQDEIASCVTAVTADTASEPVANRKWAYGCASVLTSAGFITY